MPRAYDVFKTASTRPVEAIEAIVALVTMVVGLYVASPWYVVSPGAAVGQAFDTSIQHVIVGLMFFIIPAIPTLLALFIDRCNTYRMRRIGTFMLFVSLLFVAILQTFVVGLVPLSWLYILGLSLVSGICYLYVGQKL